MAPRSRSVSTDPSFRLTPLQRQALFALSHHRLVLTSQLQRILRSDASTQQYLRKVLAGLRDAGLADRVHRPRGKDSVWFATAAGTDLAQQHGGVQERPYRMDLKRAQGPLQRHTLDVVEAGLCFLEQARRDGIPMSPYDWTPEVAHRIRDEQRPKRGFNETHVISDAVIDAVLPQKHQNGQWHFHAFLEIDRGTESPQRLAAKVKAYERYSRYIPKADKQRSKSAANRTTGEVAWSQRYTWFPALLVILAGIPERQEQERVEQLKMRTGRLPASFDGRAFRAGVTSLRKLRSYGPAAEIFEPLGTGWKKRGPLAAHLIHETAPEPEPTSSPEVKQKDQQKTAYESMRQAFRQQEQEVERLRRVEEELRSALAVEQNRTQGLNRMLKQTEADLAEAQRGFWDRAMRDRLPWL